MKRENSFRNLLLWSAFELIVVIALTAAVIFVVGVVQDARRTLIGARVELERGLEGAQEEGVLNFELNQRAHDIDRIRATIPSQNEITGVVSALEETAEATGVEITIPTVAQIEVKDELGNVVPQAGPLRDVTLQVDARGEPEALLRFFHEAEFLPFLAGVSDFELLQEVGGGRQRTVVAPVPGAGPPGSSEETGEDVNRYQLRLTLLLSTRAESDQAGSDDQ